MKHKAFFWEQVLFTLKLPWSTIFHCIQIIHQNNNKSDTFTFQQITLSRTIVQNRPWLFREKILSMNFSQFLQKDKMLFLSYEGFMAKFCQSTLSRGCILEKRTSIIKNWDGKTQRYTKRNAIRVRYGLGCLWKLAGEKEKSENVMTKADSYPTRCNFPSFPQ